MNAWLAKPIPLGLVYCDRCRAFGDTQLDAGRLFAGCGGTGFMQILGRGDRRRATIGRYIDTGQADFFLRRTISFRRPASVPFSVYLPLPRVARSPRARSMRRAQQLR
jgi:hypothetical protein